MKRGKLLIIVSIILILSVSLTSAGVFSDWWAKITGYDTSDTTALNITIGNNPPTIAWVESISLQTPTEGTTKAITFNFTATDQDGYTNINVSTASAYFQLAGETTRSNTSCINWSQSGNNVNFTCTINMWYFDKADTDWIINATITDINDASGENSSTVFQYNTLTAMKMSPTSLGWIEVGLGTVNTGSNTDPIVINNTGNDEPLNINVTALDLQGNITTTEYIYAANFTVENASEGCTGTAMVNATAINVTSAILYKGNNSLNHNNATSGQEQTYYCLKGVPQDISAQTYSSAGYGAWTIAIIT